jgi:hypothetical protein
VRLTPPFLRALHLEFFTKPSFCELFTRSSKIDETGSPLPAFSHGGGTGFFLDLGGAFQYSQNRETQFHFAELHIFHDGFRQAAKTGGG